MSVAMAEREWGARNSRGLSESNRVLAMIDEKIEELSLDSTSFVVGARRIQLCPVDR